MCSMIETIIGVTLSALAVYGFMRARKAWNNRGFARRSLPPAQTPEPDNLYVAKKSFYCPTPNAISHHFIKVGQEITVIPKTNPYLDHAVKIGWLKPKGNLDPIEIPYGWKPKRIDRNPPPYTGDSEKLVTAIFYGDFKPLYSEHYEMVGGKPRALLEYDEPLEKAVRPHRMAHKERRPEPTKEAPEPATRSSFPPDNGMSFNSIVELMDYLREQEKAQRQEAAERQPVMPGDPSIEIPPPSDVPLPIIPEVPASEAETPKGSEPNE